MTPEQLKQKPFEESYKKQQEKLDTEVGESNKDGEGTTISSDIPEQDDEEEESNITQTLQVHHGMNETARDEENSSEAEDDTSEENSVYEIESHLVNGEQNEHKDKLLCTTFEVKVEN